jgi:hypothetical protein
MKYLGRGKNMQKKTSGTFSVLISTEFCCGTGYERNLQNVQNQMCIKQKA